MTSMAASSSRTAFGPSASTSSAGAASLQNPSQSFDQEDDMITVVWGGEKYRLQLPPPDAPLSVLRKAIEERTGVAPEYQKLLMGGAVMQKDLPLKTYGLVKPSLSDEQYDPEKTPSSGFKSLLNKWGLGNSAAAGRRVRELKITMIGNPRTGAVVSDHLPGNSNRSSSTSSSRNNNPPPVPSKSVPSSLDEPRIIAQIDSLVDNTMSRLKEDLDSLLSLPVAEAQKEKQKQVYLSEMLLQTLLKLDSFEIESKWTDARKARKEGIRTVQGVLDRVDAIREGKEVPSN